MNGCEVIVVEPSYTSLYNYYNVPNLKLCIDNVDVVECFIINQIHSQQN